MENNYNGFNEEERENETVSEEQKDLQENKAPEANTVSPEENSPVTETDSEYHGFSGEVYRPIPSEPNPDFKKEQENKSFGNYEYKAYTPPVNQPGKKKRKGVGKTIALILAIVIIGGSCAGLGYYLGERDNSYDNPYDNNSEDADSNIELYYGKDHDDDDLSDVSELYYSVVDSVVGITTEGTTTNIFGMVSPTASSGTGFIIDAQNGYIMTNYHVIENGSSITVTLYSGTTLPATVVGAYEQGDIALLKISTDEKLKAVKIGSSGDLKVGEEINVIGNPLGELTYTLTHGVVSALNRQIATDNYAIEMFQIDAAVNAGNSGGPAFNEHGEVVGVVRAKVQSSSIDNIGFCIPIDRAVEIAKDLAAKGYVSGQAYLGITGQTFSNSNSFFFSYNTMSGVYVTGVVSGSAAETAGIKKGDIIVKLDDDTVSSMETLTNLISRHKAGDSAKISVYRNNEVLELDVVFDEYKPATVQETKL